MSTKELQQKITDDMKHWQKIEDAAIASTGRVIEKTDHPLIRMVMEIIQRDSQMHHRVQQFIVDTFEREAVNMSPDELAKVWDLIENHIKIERMMVGNVEEMLKRLEGKKMVVQEYLLNYLRKDEQKHDELLAALEKIKSGLYPYA